ncbi:uncharacterized protein [Haliotis asinina]|uniref:uncharacterized protein n=1 Tax=Haliotis asinina TaxID=109174 RepID=UPI0035319F46
MKMLFVLVSCSLVGFSTGFVFKPPCETQQHTCYALSTCPTGTTPLDSLCFDNKICCVGTAQCLPDPCANGVCAFVGGVNTCTCNAGFTGPICDVDVCATTSPCQNGGTCMGTTTGSRYTCNCPAGFSGANCEIDACAANGPCQNGATCVPVLGSPYQTCTCAEGFTGINCETNLCMPNPCNNGTCSPAANANGYNCTCTGNFFGVTCESNLCFGNPCDTVDTGANCTYPNPSDVQTRLCVCTASAGYFGELCELNVCQPNPCNGGTCNNIGNTDYMCTCPFNRTGKNCTEAVCPGTGTECNSRGTCVPVGTTPTCNCTEGFFGNNCESQVPPCGIPIVPRVAGGVDDAPTANPWNVKIVQTITDSVFCSGTIIDLEWIVFDGYCAAFCGGGCHVLLGNNGTVSEQVRNISNIQVHPSANFNTSILTLAAAATPDPENILPYNVAVARLSAPISPGVGINRVCPPADVYNTFRSPRNCKVSGFGQQTRINETLYANASAVVRQVLDAILIDDSVCSFIRNKSQPATTHCGFSPSGALVCNGDNGAAVVCQNASSGEWTIEGTVSYLPDNTVNTCARTFIYTDMNAVWAWIQSVITQGPIA